MPQLRQEHHGDALSIRRGAAGREGRAACVAPGAAFSIESGLPVAALDHLTDSVAPGDARFKFRLIPKATLERRRKSASKRLTSEEVPERAREFLGRPHPMLDGKVPLDVTLATSPGGADMVINLLGRAAYGGGV